VGATDAGYQTVVWIVRLGWAGVPSRAGCARDGSTKVVEKCATGNGALGSVVVVVGGAVVVVVGDPRRVLRSRPSTERRPDGAINLTRRPACVVEADDAAEPEPRSLHAVAREPMTTITRTDAAIRTVRRSPIPGS
jgi:hypothetical protein